MQHVSAGPLTRDQMNTKVKFFTPYNTNKHKSKKDENYKMNVKYYIGTKYSISYYLSAELMYTQYFTFYNFNLILSSYIFISPYYIV